MTLHVNCPECGAGITVTVQARPSFDCPLHGENCQSVWCRLARRDRQPTPDRVSPRGPFIPGHGPLETKDASHDYGEGGE